MKQRVLSGAVLVLLSAAIFLFNETFPMILNIAVALVSVSAVYELVKALDLQKKWFLCLPALLAALAVPLCPVELRFLIYALFSLAVFTAMLLYHQETSFKEVAVLYSVVVIIPMSLQTLVLLRDVSRFGIFYVVIAVLAAWVADVGAFFAGTFLGKHKLCPEISPKKTVEGAVGGLALNVAVILLFGLYVSQGVLAGDVRANYPALFLAGFLGAPISILGDLSFSLIKRSCHIKDFGNLIPGHGGILDRFDSVIFTAPFVYLLALYLPFFL